MRDKSRGKVLPFRRLPKDTGIVFERIDVEEGSPDVAYFHMREKDCTYFFSLDRDGLMVDGFRDSGPLRPDLFIDSDEDKKVRDRLTELVEVAKPIAKEQFATWDGLTPPERIRLLITWGEDQLEKAEQTMREIVNTEKPRENAEEIGLMAQDIEAFEQFLAGLHMALQTF